MIESRNTVPMAALPELVEVPASFRWLNLIQKRAEENRRAGIGIRMEGTAPVVETNTCDENEMAGIGCRDGASPILRKNQCRKNKSAGIGCRDGAGPLTVGNDCRDSEASGIGL